jgi:hypothetical protein
MGPATAPALVIHPMEESRQVVHSSYFSANDDSEVSPDVPKHVSAFLRECRYKYLVYISFDGLKAAAFVKTFEHKLEQ